MPLVCSCGGPVGQNFLPLNCLKVGFKWLYPVLCFRYVHILHNTPWVLTICKEISVKNSDKWYWTWQRLRKEKCVRVVPFAKHQITCGPAHTAPQKEAWYWSNQTIMVQNISVVSIKSWKKGIPRKVLLFWRKISAGMNRFIWILPGITGFSIQMVSAPCLPHRGPLKNARLMPLGRDKHNWSWLGPDWAIVNIQMNHPYPAKFHIPTRLCPVFSLTVVVVFIYIFSSVIITWIMFVFCSSMEDSRKSSQRSSERRWLGKS